MFGADKKGGHAGPFMRPAAMVMSGVRALKVEKRLGMIDVDDERQGW